jgi:hypothetical protein
MQHVNSGETWPLVTRWYHADRSAAEPSAITLTIHPPTGAPITVAKAAMTGSAGTAGDLTLDTWTHLLPVDADGLWRYTALGTVDGLPVTESGMFLAGVADDAPCEPWASWQDVLALCPDTPKLAEVEPGTAEYLLDVATWVLWSLDGRRYPGICTVVDRSICRRCYVCGGACVCGVRDTIDLSGGRWPIRGVWDVVVDGVELAASAYKLRGRRWLDRVDGEFWPASGDLTDPDAFRLSFAYGRTPPVGLRHAAAVFAAEMGKKCVGAKCAIPERVTSITREQVTYTILDSQRFLDEGRTGIYAVDLALSAARTARRDVAPGGYSPVTGTLV